MMHQQLRGSGHSRRRTHRISSATRQRGAQPAVGSGASRHTSRFSMVKSRLDECPLSGETRAGESRSPKIRMSANTISVITVAGIEAECVRNSDHCGMSGNKGARLHFHG